MPLDAVFLDCVKVELSNEIVDMRIERISQPQRDVLVFSVRGLGKSHKLLLSAGPSDGRVHITTYQFENPKTAPMFCMLLRKHLLGARIVSIEQPQSERVLILNMDAPDALGYVEKKQLIVELIGRSSNIILVDKEGLIVDCLRRIGGEMSDRRMVLPGLFYAYPPPQEGKLDPMSNFNDKWNEAFGNAKEKFVDRWLLSTFYALSPLICRELSYRAYGSVDFEIAAITDGGASLHEALDMLIMERKAALSKPWMLQSYDDEPKDFSYTKIKQYEDSYNVVEMDSFSQLLDSFHTRRAQMQRISQSASSLTKNLKNNRDRLVRKLEMQTQELGDTMKRDRIRETADIIMANLHSMKQGDSQLIAEDFYDSNNELRTIFLDSKKSPQQNAAQYYKEYNKAKTAQTHLEKQITLGQNELAYLQSVLSQIDLVESESDMQSIREELMETGYLKAPKNKGKIRATKATNVFETSSGYKVLVGRNNIQNDQLTMKTADKSDFWFHSQTHQGSHVVLCCDGQTPDEQSVLEAATIAAYFSSARSEDKVSVDYTFVKFVKKPSGSRPGFVTYTNYKTIIVKPDEDLVNRLRKG
ncbi:MAG: NFACT family protein [Oscillospiraceae bacterium]|nr:NFACT family protein [Oscillospiraceae bacterium]